MLKLGTSRLGVDEGIGVEEERGKQISKVPKVVNNWFLKKS